MKNMREKFLSKKKKNILNLHIDASKVFVEST